MTSGFMVLAVVLSATPFDAHWKFVWWAFAVLAVIFTAYDLWARERKKVLDLEERNRLKLTVECNEQISGCHTGRDGASHQFFRVAVTLNWTQPATGCFGKLLKIEKDGAVVRDHDVEQLPYARSHEPDALSKTLSPRAREFLDVLVIGIQHTPQQVFAPSKYGRELTLRTGSGRDVFSAPGTYILTVALCGSNIPTQTYRLRFDWTGNGDSSSLTLAERILQD
ncbi:MAG: hypothetical protein PHE83_01200 [Opitutaceae bacterium]|nr:hypothetical protein [Opitutaceae bacterium]